MTCEDSPGSGGGCPPCAVAVVAGPSMAAATAAVRLHRQGGRLSSPSWTGTPVDRWALAMTVVRLGP
ncbi:hypothetical protein LV779_27460 [Streptomyces thinghirensis]|nr:hypothetical protein [Streptomyces thinghirensis]